MELTTGTAYGTIAILLLFVTFSLFFEEEEYAFCLTIFCE